MLDIMKTNFILLFLVITHLSIFSQNSVYCGAQAVGADECENACISCTNAQFLNLVGSTEVMTPSGNTTVWCSTIENDQYYGFIAGSSTVSITFTNMGCTIGSGLQGAIHGPDCSGVTQGCQTGIPPGASATITGTGLTIGKIYYLVIDGIAGSQCGFQITNASGVGSLSPNITNISGSLNVCPGREWEYTAISAGATKFNWRLQAKPVGSTFTLNGDTLISSNDIFTTDNSKVKVKFDRPGTYTFCVQGENSCNRATFRCITVVVTIPTRPAQVRNLCDNDIIPWCNTEPDFDASLYPAPSTQQNKCFIQESNGCLGEQNWTFNIKESPILPTIDSVICDGESIEFKDDFGPVGPFKGSGNFNVLLERRRPKCDEKFQLNLSTINLRDAISGSFSSVITCKDKVVPVSVLIEQPPLFSNYIFEWSGPEIIGRNNTRSIMVGKAGAYVLRVRLKGTQSNPNYLYPCEEKIVVYVNDDCDIIGQGPTNPNDSINGVFERSILKTEIISNLFLFPNPVVSGTDLNIQYFTETDISSNVKIIGLDRKVFSTRKIEFVHGENVLSIPTHGLSSGMYFLDVSTSQEKKVLKFVVY
jgi:hypothetical protein